ncbi:hypothetical protein IPM09_05270 [Candidatus Saccharibacteria bacterium]|nr:MAG: hypothetical protein IPM09_05270 [Candidatus Saccharibacteria bacterium]
METFSGRGSRQPVPHREPATHHEPEMAVPEPAAPQHSYVPRSPRVTEKAKKSWLMKAVIVVVLLGVLAAGVWGYNTLTQGQLIDTGKYQAVFLTNGQVYFGKLSRVSGDTYKLNKIFYLQENQTASDSNNPQKTSATNTDVQLIKLGNEVHGPDDQMVIDKSQVLFYENLNKDGKVSKSIAEYYAKK